MLFGYMLVCLCVLVGVHVCVVYVYVCGIWCHGLVELYGSLLRAISKFGTLFIANDECARTL